MYEGDARMLGAKVKIIRYVDGSQPGWVECELVDASGAGHRFIDKVPVFTDKMLDEHSIYPVDGEINFEIVEEKTATSIVTTELPWHLESKDGKTVFEIPNAAIMELQDHHAEVISVQIGAWNYPLIEKPLIDISIPLRFGGPQPNAYGVDTATSVPYTAGDIVGDTRRGGSCNFEQYTFIPHCNGTHTECVGHITDDRIAVTDCLKDVLIPALLVTIASVKARQTDDTYPVDFGPADLVITRSSLEKAVAHPAARSGEWALIVRTLPNDERKLTRKYGEDLPPYFTTQAIEYVVECGFKHLLVDMPSIDRMYDEGKLSNHRIFWNVEQGSRSTHTGTRIYSTITELIYAPNDVEDGQYLLNLQIAPFAADASPSRPVLFRGAGAGRF